MDEQPTRSGTYREPREFDKTSLRANQHEFRISRDYLGHCLRWGFVRKFVNHSTSVLDVGCGVDLPLLKTLAGGYANMTPSHYTGVDLNKIGKRPGMKWATILDKFNFVADYDKLSKYDVVTCFEVLEHATRENGDKMLAGLKHCLAKDGTLFLSTPVFKKTKAKNHCYEYGLDELREAIEKVGLKVEKTYGTFASYHDIKRVAKPEELVILDQLNEFLHGDVTAIFLASLYPEASRNVTWVVKHADIVE